MNTTNKRSSKNTRTMQRRAADHMAFGKTIAEAAYELGVKYDTVARWQSSEAFRERMALHRAAGRRRTGILLAEALENALDRAVHHPSDGKEALAGIAQLARLVELEAFFDHTVGKDAPEFGKSAPESGLESGKDTLQDGNTPLFSGNILRVGNRIAGVV